MEIPAHDDINKPIFGYSSNHQPGRRGQALSILDGTQGTRDDVRVERLRQVALLRLLNSRRDEVWGYP
jgi:hypothetical protein